MQKNQFGEPQNILWLLLDRLSPFVLLNLAWAVLSLPVITIIPATGGLYYATYVLVRDEDASIMDVWRGFKQYFWVSWWWAGLNLVVIGVLVTNYIFYANFTGSWTSWARLTVVLVLFFWLCLQLYTFPLLIFQEDKRLKTAVRNSYVALILRPFPTIGWTLLVLTIAALSTFYAFPTWTIFTATMCLFICNFATRQTMRALKPEVIAGVEEVKSEE